VHVVELRGVDKEKWPRNENETDDVLRPNRRRLKGARHYIASTECESGRLTHKGTVRLDSGPVAAHWFLWKGDRPAVGSYAQQTGYIAMRYEGELFHLDRSVTRYRSFGIVEAEVRRNLSIILEADSLEPTGEAWGVFPDQSRGRLQFTGNGHKGGELPIQEWGAGVLGEDTQGGQESHQGDAGRQPAQGFKRL